MTVNILPNMTSGNNNLNNLRVAIPMDLSNFTVNFNMFRWGKKLNNSKYEKFSILKHHNCWNSSQNEKLIGSVCGCVCVHVCSDVIPLH